MEDAGEVDAARSMARMDEKTRPEVGMGIFLLAPKLLLLPEPIMNLAPRMALWRNLGCLG